MTPAICDFAVNELKIRGRDIGELIREETFLSMIVLTLTGEYTEPETAAMLERLLIAWVDHGQEPPSTQNVRNVASVHQSFPHAVIAGLATFGGVHVPIDQAARFLQMMTQLSTAESKLALVESFPRVPGFGHPVHLEDPRVAPLLEIAQHVLGEGAFLKALADAQAAVNQMINRRAGVDVPFPLHPNLAGVTAAIWLDMGFSLETVALIPVIGRIVGWAAHYADQRSLPPFSGSIPPFAKP